MPSIDFRLVATQEQLQQIEEDFCAFIRTQGDALDAHCEMQRGHTPDPQLLSTWVDLCGDVDGAEGALLRVRVVHYRGSSLSGLAMRFGKILMVPEDVPAEPVVRQVKDDPGVPRVPWHVEVQP